MPTNEKRDSHVSSSSDDASQFVQHGNSASQVLTIADDEDALSSSRARSRPPSTVFEASMEAATTRPQLEGVHDSEAQQEEHGGGHHHHDDHHHDPTSAPASRSNSPHASRASTADSESASQRDAQGMLPPPSTAVGAARRPSDGSVRGAMDPRPPTKPSVHPNTGSRPGSGRLSRPGSRAGGSRPSSAILGGGDDSKPIVSSS
jgi:hypothetical protein